MGIAAEQETQRLHHFRLLECTPCDILENMDCFNPRVGSQNFLSLTRMLPSNTFVNEASSIAMIAEKKLKDLSHQKSIYDNYASADIIEGLACIRHPATQLLLTQYIDDPRSDIKRRAEAALTKPTAVIFSETLTYLFKMPETQASKETNKTRSRHIALGLSILTTNKPAYEYDIDLSRTEILEPLNLLLSTPGKQTDIQTALVISVLHENRHGKVPVELTDKAISVLDHYLTSVVEQLRNPIVYDMWIKRTATHEPNVGIAIKTLHSLMEQPFLESKIIESVRTLPIALPDDMPGAVESTALRRLITPQYIKILEPESNAKPIEVESLIDYRGLIGYIKTEVRQLLIATMKTENKRLFDALQALEAQNKKEKEKLANSVNNAHNAKNSRLQAQVDEATDDFTLGNIVRDRFHLNGARNNP